MLRRAIRSAVSQNYNGKIEIIVVSDPPYYEEFEKAISAIKPDLKNNINVVHVKTPKPRSGPSTARNIGLQNTSYDLVGFLDDDDEWLPNKLQLQLLYLRKHKLDVLLTSCLNLRNNICKRYPSTIKEKFKILDKKDVVVHGLGLTSTALAYRSKLLEVGGFNENLRIGEDIDIWLRLLDNGAKIGFLNIPTVIRHLHAGNITMDSSIKALNRALKFTLKFLPYYKDSMDILSSKLYSLGKRSLRITPNTAEGLLRLAMTTGPLNIKLRIILFNIIRKALPREYALMTQNVLSNYYRTWIKKK